MLTLNISGGDEVVVDVDTVHRERLIGDGWAAGSSKMQMVLCLLYTIVRIGEYVEFKAERLGRESARVQENPGLCVPEGSSRIYSVD